MDPRSCILLLGVCNGASCIAYMTDLATRARRRHKIPLACQRCRSKKLKCDGSDPCSNCKNVASDCVYARNATQEKAYIPQKKTYLQERSVMELVKGLLPKSSDSSCWSHLETSAIPGSFAQGVDTEVLRISDFLPVDTLPQPGERMELFIFFVRSFHWFMMAFQEASEKAAFQRMFEDGHCKVSEKNRLRLYFMIMSLGSYYASLHPEQGYRKEQLLNWHILFLQQVENSFMDIMSTPDTPAVQVCILLGSFYLFNGRPGAGFGVVGSGIKLGHVISLHRRKTPGDNTPLEQLESRRRAWWALEIYDKYSAIAYGRACTVNDADCDIEDISQVGSDDPCDFGMIRYGSISLLTYHGLKCKIYRIMGPFLGRLVQTKRLESISQLDTKLKNWYRLIPAELDVDQICQENSKQGIQSVVPNTDMQLFQAQALSLQLTYDNLQIVLHRTAAFPDVSTFSGVDSLTADSRQRLLESAMKTASLEKYPGTISYVMYTHASMHIGICFLTAGIVLCLLIIHETESGRALEARKGVPLIINVLYQMRASSQLLSTQGFLVLNGLVKHIHEVVDKGSPDYASDLERSNEMAATILDELAASVQQADVPNGEAFASADDLQKSWGLNEFESNSLFSNGTAADVLTSNLATGDQLWLWSTLFEQEE